MNHTSSHPYNNKSEPIQPDGTIDITITNTHPTNIDRTDQPGVIPHNNYQVFVLSSTLLIDILFSTFITPFLPSLLLQQQYTTYQISLLMSVYWLCSLIGYVCVVVYTNMPQHNNNIPNMNIIDIKSYSDKTTYNQWCFITTSTVIVTSAGLLPVIYPHYIAIILSRIIQGFLSAYFWSYNISIASSLNSVWSINPVSIALAGSSLGDLSGPLLGTALWSMYSNIRFAYSCISVLAAVNSICTICVYQHIKKQYISTQLHLQTLQSIQTIDIDQSNNMIVCPRYNHTIQHSTMLSTRSLHDKLYAIYESICIICHILIEPLMLQYGCILFLNGCVRTCLDTVLPLYMTIQLQINSVHIGIVFGIGALMYVAGSIVTGKLIYTMKHMDYIICGIQCTVSCITCIMLYTYNYILLVLCIGLLMMCFAMQSVICCQQLEYSAQYVTTYKSNTYQHVSHAHNGTDTSNINSTAKHSSSTQTTQILSIAMCVWTIGYAVGGQLSGIGTTTQLQQYVLIGLGICNGLYVVIYIAQHLYRQYNDSNLAKRAIIELTHSNVA